MIWILISGIIIFKLNIRLVSFNAILTFKQLYYVWGHLFMTVRMHLLTVTPCAPVSPWDEPRLFWFLVSRSSYRNLVLIVERDCGKADASCGFHIMQTILLFFLLKVMILYGNPVLGSQRVLNTKWDYILFKQSNASVQCVTVIGIVSTKALKQVLDCEGSHHPSCFVLWCDIPL